MNKEPVLEEATLIGC